jgi:hypothetical protein
VGRLAPPVLFTLASLAAAIVDTQRARKPPHTPIVHAARKRRAAAAAVRAPAVDGIPPEAG